jgi:hypothetical protein
MDNANPNSNRAALGAAPVLRRPPSGVSIGFSPEEFFSILASDTGLF